MIPGIVAGGLRNKLAIENLVPLGLDKSTAYYRFREDRAYSYGPPALGEVPYLNTLRIWEAFQQDDEIILKTSDTETSLVTGISNKLNNLSFTFDQNGFPLIVWEYNKEIYLRWYDPVANDTVTTNLGAGYSPFIALETFNENLKPERTILLAHIDENLNLVHRLQDDRWAEAYLIKENVKDIIGFGTTNYNNIKLVYVNDKDINDEYVIEFIATDRLGLYEFDTLYARSIVAELNAVTYADSTVQTIGYELPLSIEVDNVESSIGQFKTYTNVDYPDIHELPLEIDVSNVQSAITVKTIGYQRIYPNDFAENKLEVIPEILSMDIRNSSIVSTLEDFAENKLEVIPEIQSFDVSPGYVYPENESRYSQWSWMNKNSDIVLSNDRITALIPPEESDVDGIVKSVVTRGSFKKYVELKIVSLDPSDTCSVGIGLSDAPLGDLATRNSHTWELFSDGNSIHNGDNISTAPYEEGDVIGIAVDIEAGMLWWAINGVWLNDGDPENGINPFYTDLNVTEYNIISAPTSNNTRISLHIPDDTWEYTIPEGFESWLDNTITEMYIEGNIIGGANLESYNVNLNALNAVGDVTWSIVDMEYSPTIYPEIVDVLSQSAANAATFTVNIPASDAGDLLILHMSLHSRLLNSTNPVGWSRIFSEITMKVLGIAVLGKISSGEPAHTITFTLNGKPDLSSLYSVYKIKSGTHSVSDVSLIPYNYTNDYGVVPALSDVSLKDKNNLFMQLSVVSSASAGNVSDGNGGGPTFRFGDNIHYFNNGIWGNFVYPAIASSTLNTQNYYVDSATIKLRASNETPSTVILAIPGLNSK